MLDFDLGQALSALAKTFPFLVFRLVVYLGIAIAYAFAVGGGAAIGAGLGLLASAAGGGALWGGLIGFGVVSGIVYWAREYLLYLVKAAHIAVLVEVLEGKELPSGRRQIDHAQQVVRERFVETSVLFGIDQLIKGVLRVLNRMLLTVSSFLPIPALRNLIGFANKVINLSLTYTDEIILAHNIRQRSDNPWESSKDALVLYAQNYKVMLKNALFLLFVLWGLTAAIFVVFLAPAGLLATILPGPVGGLGFLMALALALATKAAVIEPFAVVALLQVYLKVTEGQSPEPEWDAKLSDASAKFRELKDKAIAHAGAPTVAET